MRSLRVAVIFEKRDVFVLLLLLLFSGNDETIYIAFNIENNNTDIPIYYNIYRAC